MEKLKVMTVIGTRPEIIRLSAVINKLESTDAIEHILVHTGQNYDYELNEVFFNDFNLRKPDFFLDAAQGKPMETIGNILIKIDPILEKTSPDALLVLGDTNSCLCALAAKRRKIPIFHMEAGNRCFDQRVPEETNRKIVDHISDVNLTYSNIAREYLIKEGFPADRVIKTGSPIYEVLQTQGNKIKDESVLARLGLTEKEYFVISAHREENINSEKNFLALVDTMNAIAEKYKIPLIVSTHPRTKAMIDSKGVKFHELVQLAKPLGFNDYISLQVNAKAVISDSGTISEEASILKLKALNIREAHERPEAMEEAAVMMVGVQKDRVLQGLEILEQQTDEDLAPVKEYFNHNVSEKVLRIIISYTDYIKRNVWKEDR